MEDQRLDNQIEISGTIHSPVDTNVDIYGLCEQLTSLDLEELKNFCQKVNSENTQTIIPERLNLVEFEMLEAELRNQGILQKVQETISQNINRETSQLTWSVRHHLKSEQEIVYYINVSEYIFKKTVANINQLNTHASKPEDTTHKELRYLNQFATYLNGAYDEVTTAYERGLNLVLRSIRSGGQNLDYEKGQQIEVTFPIDRKNLMKRILNF